MKILLRFLKKLLRFSESRQNEDIIWSQYFCITPVMEWIRSYSEMWKVLTKILKILLRFLKILVRFSESRQSVDIIWCQYFCITTVREWARSYSGMWKVLTKIFENLTKIFQNFTQIFRISSKCRYHLVAISCLNSEPTAC